MHIGVFSFLFYLNFFLGFGLLFCRIELNIIQFFLAKRYPFSILDFSHKREKKPKYTHPPHEKFGILDGTKHTHEYFGILHFIILKWLTFYILPSTRNLAQPNFWLGKRFHKTEWQIHVDIKDNVALTLSTNFSARNETKHSSDSPFGVRCRLLSPSSETKHQSKCDIWIETPGS
jgi:hypothetical protein